ncbi:MAG: cytochrome C [Candidatus Wallbacteria bacterium]|nr:cytochrome C [Candidatus Wallbacteria bacterium]
MHQFWEIISKADNVPIVIMLVLVCFFTWLSFREALKYDRARAEGKTVKQAVYAEEAGFPERVAVWPHLVRQEFLVAIGVTIFLMLWSIALDAPLEELANPNVTPNPSKAPWYFLGLQELLVYFDPWIAGVMLPNVIVVGLMAIPYIDINPKGSGYYTLRERPLAISIFLFGFLFLWVLMVCIGTFARGPGWLWFWPWQHWDVHRVVAETNIDFSDKFFGVDSASPMGFWIGLAAVALWFPAVMFPPLLLPSFRRSEFFQRLGIVRYLVFASLLATMLATPVKMILRIFLHVKYIWVTEWFNV